MVSKEEYFRRQIEQWGEDTQTQLQFKKIAIVGCGGLGCSLGMALGSSGIGRIDLVDFDRVSAGNIHRQIAFGMDDVGLYKSKVLAKRIKQKNPFVSLNALVMNADEFFELGVEYDLILDATDNYDARYEIDRYCSVSKTPWIYASVEGFNGQLCFFSQSSFSDFNKTTHTPGGIAAPMVMQIASMQANFALRYLCGYEIQKDRLFYVYYDNMGSPVIKSFNMRGR